MATALVHGFVKANCIAKENVFVCTRSEPTAEKWRANGYNAHTFETFYERVEPTAIVILAVKPQNFTELAGQLRQQPTWTDGRSPALFISVMAGVRLGNLKAMVGKHPQDEFVRLVPNTACAVGRGALCLAANESVRQETIDLVVMLAETVGTCFVVSESAFEAAGALTACSTGWIFEMVEGLVEGGAANGIGREVATQMVANALRGSAQLLLDSGKVPLTLQSEVCSPKGTTLAGLERLKANGVGNAFKEAVDRSIERANELSAALMP